MDSDEFPFRVVPEDLQIGILKKFYYDEFATFEKCSSYAHFLCEKNKNLRFPTLLSELHFTRTEGISMVKSVDSEKEECRIRKQERFKIETVYIQERLTEEICEFLTNFAEFSILNCVEPISCSEDSFLKLLKGRSLKSFYYNLWHEATNIIFDFSLIDSVSIANARRMSSASFLSMKPKSNLHILGGFALSACDVVQHIQHWISRWEHFESADFLLHSPISQEDFRNNLAELGPLLDEFYIKTSLSSNHYVKPNEHSKPFMRITVTSTSIEMSKIQHQKYSKRPKRNNRQGH